MKHAERHLSRKPKISNLRAAEVSTKPLRSAHALEQTIMTNRSIRRSTLNKPLPSLPTRADASQSEVRRAAWSGGGRNHSSSHMSMGSLPPRTSSRGRCDVLTFNRQWTPTVTREAIIRQTHEIREEQITREIHEHHYYHRLQPILDTEVLPARHFVLADEKFVEVRADQFPEELRNRIEESIARELDNARNEDIPYWSHSSRTQASIKDIHTCVWPHVWIELHEIEITTGRGGMVEVEHRSAVVESPYLRSLLAGGIAGTTVDTSLFPLDTLKTRLQSSAGFWGSGGFRGVYNGIGSAIVGSAPGAALFFVTYEGVKTRWNTTTTTGSTSAAAAAAAAASHGERSALGDAGVHMLAASAGEVAACAVRVPTEVVKQRAQAKQHPSSLAALTSILRQRRQHGLLRVWAELYRGWGITVMREVPFTVIQFPLWEGMKSWAAMRNARHDNGGGGEGGGLQSVGGLESAVFGSVSGAIAAALTTPLDVLKTRMMLATERQSVVAMASSIWRIEGPGAFLRGIGPRTMWISIGGAVFLGSYQWASNLLAGL